MCHHVGGTRADTDECHSSPEVWWNFLVLNSSHMIHNTQSSPICLTQPFVIPSSFYDIVNIKWQVATVDTDDINSGYHSYNKSITPRPLYLPKYLFMKLLVLVKLNNQSGLWCQSRPVLCVDKLQYSCWLFFFFCTSKWTWNDRCEETIYKSKSNDSSAIIPAPDSLAAVQRRSGGTWKQWNLREQTNARLA